MTPEEIMDRLLMPFEPGEIRFKPGVISGNRALVLYYIDARTVQDRLDDVMGVLGWKDSYTVLPDGNVVCTLALKIGDEWIAKMDVGGPSEQPDDGDKAKAAFSDALKRAAVKFGIGRFLYRLPHQWVDYDPAKRRFARDPVLPYDLYKKPVQPALPAPAKPWPDDSQMDPAEPITAEMATRLAQAIEEAGYSVEAALRKWKLDALINLNVIDYREKRAAIEKAPPRSRERTDPDYARRQKATQP